MKKIILLLSAILSAASWTWADESSYVNSIPYSPSMAIRLDCRAGDINLRGHEGQTVDIQAWGQSQPTVSVSDSQINIAVPGSHDLDGFRMDISLPRNATMDLELPVGDLRLEGLSGKVKAKVGVGDVRARNFSGDFIIEVGTGDISAAWDAESALPAQGRLATGVGDIGIYLPQDGRVRISAQTGLGSISSPGAKLSGASKTLAWGEGDKVLDLSTGIGDIQIKNSLDFKDKFGKRRSRRTVGQGYFGAGGGFFVSWPDRSYRDLNAAIQAFGYPEVKKESHAWGGEGYVQFNRFRIGGMGWGNKIESRTSQNDTLRYATYDYGYGGLTLEYVVLRSSRADLSLGAMLGGGAADIRLARAKSSDITWEEAARLENYREVSLKASGFAGMPLARLRIKLLGWLSLQAQAGYLYCRFGDWRYQEDRDLFNPPRLDASGWVLSAGPHFGF